MRSQLVAKLRCPACNRAGLSLESDEIIRVPYRTGPIDETKSGRVGCRCGQQLPVDDFVLSYGAFFSDDVRKDGQYWADFYAFMARKGFEGYFDQRRPVAPLAANGVMVPAPLSPAGPGGYPVLFADQLLGRGARELLDVGCGAGWSALLLAQKGFDVCAFDPSLPLMKLAKAYAMRDGTFVEYVAADLSRLKFVTASFDAVSAFHSLHHVPDLGARMADIRELLRPGGFIAVEDHHQHYELGTKLSEAMSRWTRIEIVGQQGLEPDPDLSGLPPGASHNEDTSLGQTLEEAARLFHLESLTTRFTFLNQFSFLYYLVRQKNLVAYNEASAVVDVLYRLWLEAFPDQAEYVAFIGQKRDPLPKFQPVVETVDAEQPRSEVTTGELVDGFSVAQDFTPQHDFLMAIEVRLATFARTNTHDVVLRLEDLRNRRELARVAINAATLPDNEFTRFAFEPLERVVGRPLRFTVESPGSRSGDAVTMFATTRSIVPPGPHRRNGVATEGTLAFRVICARDVRATFAARKTTLQRLSYLYWEGGLTRVLEKVKNRLRSNQ